mmetsp:Transcript_13899/g.19304  ORF Transcript_13899/g.19304 Transcript_13899/m.19304 type:complete len:103 (-) Transcript_13899:147-455(-)
MRRGHGSNPKPPQLLWERTFKPGELGHVLGKCTQFGKSTSAWTTLSTKKQVRVHYNQRAKGEHLLSNCPHNACDYCNTSILIDLDAGIDSRSQATSHIHVSN